MIRLETSNQSGLEISILLSVTEPNANAANVNGTIKLKIIYACLVFLALINYKKKVKLLVSLKLLYVLFFILT